MEPNTLEITEQPALYGFASIRDLVNQTLQQDFGTNITPEGASSGFKELDKALGGFQPGHLYTIAVKPGMGKTAFLLSLANNMAIKDDYAVAILSSERSNHKMTSRLIESETGMSLNKLRSWEFKDSERDHMRSLLGTIAKSKIYIDDTSSLSLETLSEKVRHLKKAQHVDLVIVDYLELLTAADAEEGDDRPTQLARIVKGIKSVASETDIPILLFSQTARQANGHLSTKRPTLDVLPAFLSESTDVLMYLHRNDLYANGEDEETEARSPVELIFSKREAPGEEVVVPLSFIESTSKFADFS